ncbi:cupin domain-containing protein [Rhizobium sp. Root1220]|uniref:cupin domain-containing protein n=1 Tax=Rhizobium sp. Root1220 TaxID=1736432 RepID=UPI0006F9F1CC|nr:cupin domain-containing protein [Rhizobium sp. Root1220]KQV83578.1 cupin [Rhizobium sp. Root1220]
MNMKRMMAAAVLATAISLSLQPVYAQQPQLHRTDLVKSDISAPGHEAVQVRVDFDPGAVSIKHRHPGEEIAYVLEGTIEYQLEGKKPVALKAGDSLFIPDGVAHLARNVGDGKASELATYVVRKGATLVEPAE